MRGRDEPEPGERRPEETERHEHERRHESPIRTAEQDAPAEERPTTPDEEQGQDIGEMEEPPQAEGPRDTE